MATSAPNLRARCADEMSRTPRGFGDANWLRDAFLTIPREHFVPDRVWWPAPRPDGLYNMLDRGSRPTAWLKAVYMPGAPLITQLDDGAIAPTGPANGTFTSSISSSGVVVELLRHLDPRPGDRVLEIGTGTGYTTALLAARAGAQTVVTVEIDPDLAFRAQQRLAELGTRPHIVIGDGETGYPEGGPYDRIVATASVRQIPRPWIEQLAPGGVLIAPMDSPFGCDLLARLVGDGTGQARGAFVAQVTFMRMRSHRQPRPYAGLGWPVSADPTAVDPTDWDQLTVEVDAAGQRIFPSSDLPARLVEE